MIRSLGIAALVLVSSVSASLGSGSQPIPPAPGSSGQSPVFTPGDLLDVVVARQVAVSPAGDRVAYVLPDMEDEWNILERNKVGYVHVQEVDVSSEAMPLTRGAERSSFPTWSPDGTKLAFFIEEHAGAVESRSSGVERQSGGRLAVWNRLTGDLTRHGHRFTGRASTGPRWAGNDRIVYATPVVPPPAPEKPRVEVVRSTDRIIPGDAVFTRAGESGIAMIDLSGGDLLELGEAVVLRQFSVAPGRDFMIYTSPTAATLGIIGGEVNETYLVSLTDFQTLKIAERGERFAWSHDGSRLVRRTRQGLSAFAIEHDAAFPGDAVSPDAGRIGDPEAYLGNVRISLGSITWSPDGTMFATLAADPSLRDPEVEPGQPGMYSIDRPYTDVYVIDAVSGAAVNVSAGFEDGVSNPVWSPDGESLVFRAVHNQTYDETIYRYTIETGALDVVTRGEESYDSVHAGNDHVVLRIQSATTAPDLWRIDGDGDRHRLTDLNPRLRDFEFSKPSLFDFENADGERMAALLYLPPESARAPGMITQIYEKLTPGVHRFDPRPQMFVSHGYALLMPNVKIKVGQPGTSYVTNVVPAVEMVQRSGLTNGKACLWGGSFGAYGVAFVITQTDIFDCAVSRATPPELFRNWASGRDRDSNNIESGQARMGGNPFEVQERYIEQSPFFHLDKVTTPVLITHGVKDTTILFGEGEMMFYALRRLGKTAEFVIYNEGDHSLSRHSRQDTIDVNRRMLAWFERYLR